MDIEEILESIGLSQQESKVYIALLRLSSSTASRISMEARLNRSLIYQILDGLISKGFASYVIRENVRYYCGVHPSKLLDILEEREENLKSILPQLSNLRKEEGGKPIVEILEGKEGIKTVLNDILKLKEDWFALASGKVLDVLPYYAENWEKIRQKQGIRAKAIFDDSIPGRKRGKKFERMKLTEVRYMPKKYSNPASIWIYGNRVALVILSREHCFAIRIKSEDIAETYTNHFNTLWGLSKG